MALAHEKMNVSRLGLACRSILLLLTVSSGTVSADSIFGHSTTVANPEATAAALAAAQAWVAEIDAGHYEQSYDEGCTAFHNKVPQDQWITVLKAIRPKLGTVLSRKESSARYKPDGYEGLDGECMVITYTTSFSKMASELEVIVMKREDGKWRGAGYNAQPQVDETTQDQGDSSSMPDTSTSTQPYTPPSSSPTQAQ
jgi:hypothetical protein